MKTLTVKLPDVDEKEAKTLLAARLGETVSLSLGQAADMTAYSKRTFMELLGSYEVSFLIIRKKNWVKKPRDAQNYHL